MLSEALVSCPLFTTDDGAGHPVADAVLLAQLCHPLPQSAPVTARGAVTALRIELLVDGYLLRIDARQLLQEIGFLLIGEGQPTGQDEAAAVISSPAHHRFQVVVIVVDAGEDGHEGCASEDARLGELLHGLEAARRHGHGRLEAFEVLVIGRFGGGDNTEADHGSRPMVDGRDQLQILQHVMRFLQHEDGEAQVETDLEHLAREAMLPLGGLVVAQTDDVHRRLRELLTQELRRVDLHLDQPGKIIGIRVGAILALAPVAILTAMLTAYVGVGGIARPEPVVSTFVLVQDAPGSVDFIFDRHGP